MLHGDATDIVEDVALQTLVENVAIDFRRKFHQTSDRTDIEQELWLWVVLHGHRVNEWLVEEDGLRSIRKGLRNAAMDFCLKEKAERGGYSRGDIAFYRRGEIELLLPSIFSDQDWQYPPQSEGERRGRKPLNEGNNWIAGLGDVARAYDSLGREDRALLYLLHVDEALQKDVAEAQGVSQQKISYQNGRALDRMLRFLGGRGPGRPHYDDCDWECGLGTRQSISNATARARTGQDYDV